MCRIMAALLLSLTAHAAMALELKTVPTADGSGLAQATVESVDYRVKIIFSRGARIAELTDLTLDPIQERITLSEFERGRWRHFVWTWDNTQGMRGYLDGKRISDNWGTATWVQMMTPDVMKLGSMSAIDELILFKRALTPKEMLDLSRGVLPRPRRSWMNP